MNSRNRMYNAHNPHQGSNKRVLAVCSAGLLRSPTIAWVLSNPPYNYNTRAAGMSSDFALVAVDDVLLHWAQEIVCAEQWMADVLNKKLEGRRRVVSLDLPDQYNYRDPELVALIKERYKKHDD